MTELINTPTQSKMEDSSTGSSPRLWTQECEEARQGLAIPGNLFFALADGVLGLESRLPFSLMSLDDVWNILETRDSLGHLVPGALSMWSLHAPWVED